jgi:D-sedoheptulose 7-phosphate isomerase
MNAPVEHQDREFLREYLVSGHPTAEQDALEGLVESVSELAGRMRETLRAGGTVFWMGNGGSAAQAQHAACELVGRFAEDRDPLRSISLVADASVLTGISNDFGFEEVFSRQLLALASPGDLVIGLSTSGASENVLRGLAAGRAVGARTACLTGADVSAVVDRCDHLVAVGSSTTARIQEVHLRIIHALVCWIERSAGYGA